MSKLDRFLVSEGLVSVYPNISAITLDRYLSYHHPILLRESNFDFGPTPFCFFHYWFDIEGFDEFVKTTWINAQVTDHNVIGMFMKKLKFLKGKIHEWIKVKRINSSNHKVELKKQLAMIDKLVDKGKGNSEILNNRSFIFKSLQDIEKLESMELLAIRGMLVDGIWTKSPELVRNEFLCHFKNRFDKPQSPRIMIDMDFPIQLSLEQQEEMECNITREEIKRAVWVYGTDKSSGPDCFNFGFYRRFWCVIENVVVETVNTFFQDTTFPKGEYIHRKMGNGIETCFWDDVWKGDVALKYQFPCIYALESDKKILVATKLGHDSLEFSLHRIPKGGIEQVQYNKLQRFTEGTVFANSRDRWSWSLDGSGVFSIASIRRIIDDKYLPSFSSKTRWNSLEFQDTANSGQKKAMVFYQMDTEEVSDRFMVPCFVNGLEAYDGEINLGIEENMISNETVTIYPDIDPFLEETEGEEKRNDDWDHLLYFNIDDVPLLGEERLSPFMCRMGKSGRNKKRAMENLYFFYQDVGTSSLAEGREDMNKVDRGITMKNHTQAEAMRILPNVVCQLGVTTLIAKFLISDIPMDRDSPIVVGRRFLRTIGAIVNNPE
uniref:RNA-directed DNA polymerase, eukaryota n=1 Tax=Tanacetum cinerariifolium TaxID=118510 RepID=A0A6L2KDC5_TANCI|nr:RNA-directed DNA polymerase, eukaryota [Tanacetum cinerariifolium]